MSSWCCIIVRNRPHRLTAGRRFLCHSPSRFVGVHGRRSSRVLDESHVGTFLTDPPRGGAGRCSRDAGSGAEGAAPRLAGDGEYARCRARRCTRPRRRWGSERGRDFAESWALIRRASGAGAGRAASVPAPVARGSRAVVALLLARTVRGRPRAGPASARGRLDSVRSGPRALRGDATGGDDPSRSQI